MVGALAALLSQDPVAHVEAGLTLRRDLSSCPKSEPRIVAPIADLHFAPTETAAAALARENVTGRVHVTGNTVIDALHWTRARITEQPDLAGDLAPLLARFAGKRDRVGHDASPREFRRRHGGDRRAIARIAERPERRRAFPDAPQSQCRGVMDAVLPAAPNVRGGSRRSIIRISSARSTPARLPDRLGRRAGGSTRTRQDPCW